MMLMDGKRGKFIHLIMENRNGIILEYMENMRMIICGMTTDVAEQQES